MYDKSVVEILDGPDQLQEEALDLRLREGRPHDVQQAGQVVLHVFKDERQAENDIGQRAAV